MATMVTRTRLTVTFAHTLPVLLSAVPCDILCQIPEILYIFSPNPLYYSIYKDKKFRKTKSINSKLAKKIKYLTFRQIMQYTGSTLHITGTEHFAIY